MYGEHKELSQYVWEAMHTALPIASTSGAVSQLPTGDVLDPDIIKWVETQDLGSPKVKGIEDSGSEKEDEEQK